MGLSLHLVILQVGIPLGRVELERRQNPVIFGRDETLSIFRSRRTKPPCSGTENPQEKRSKLFG